MRTDGGGADEATELTLAQLVDERHADAGERHADPPGGGARHGPFRGPRRGHGLEFDDLRPYTAGDDVRHVDWKTSARRAALHTRLHREEKEHAVTVALDLRASMYTGSATLRAVVAGRLAARLLWRASAGGSRTGVAALHAGGVSLSRPASGERGVLPACRLIAETFATGRQEAGRTTAARAASGRATSDREITLQTLFERLLAGGRAVGTVVVVSGMDAPGAAFDDALERLAAARRLAAVHVEDPIERVALPSGRYRYESANGTNTVHLGRGERRRLGDALAEGRAALAARFDATSVPLLSSADGTSAVLAALGRDGLLS